MSEINELDKQLSILKYQYTNIASKLESIDNSLQAVVLERQLEKGSINTLKWLFGAVSGMLLALVISMYNFYNTTVANDRAHTESIHAIENRLTKLEDRAK